jgi:hypothetical protein
MDRLCEICGSNKYVQFNKQISKYLCVKHRHHIERYGEIKERTRYDKNEIIKYNDYAEMFLYDMKNNIVASTIIDLEDIERINKFKWCLSKNKYKKNYVITTINDSLVLLHRMLMDAPDDVYIDHIDRNPLNNKKENLRNCTMQQNNMNLSLGKNNTSGVIGVCWHSQANKWRSYIMLDRKQKHLGLFDNFEGMIAIPTILYLFFFYNLN